MAIFIRIQLPIFSVFRKSCFLNFLPHSAIVILKGSGVREAKAPNRDRKSVRSNICYFINSFERAQGRSLLPPLESFLEARGSCRQGGSGGGVAPRGQQ